MSAINYFNTRIDKCINQLGIYSFSVGELEEEVRNKGSTLTEKGQITITIRFLIPDIDTDYLRVARAENLLKSHDPTQNEYCVFKSA